MHRKVENKIQVKWNENFKVSKIKMKLTYPSKMFKQVESRNCLLSNIHINIYVCIVCIIEKFESKR